MAIKSTQLYNLLIYYRKMDNVFKNTFDIYFYMYGYDHGQVNKNLPGEEREEWIYDFSSFIRKKLEDMYWPKVFSLWYNHFGEMIEIIEPNEKKGITLFYSILDEFVEIQNKTDSVNL